MTFHGSTARRRFAGAGTVWLLGGLAAATIAAPAASAAPDCSPGGVANTVSSAWGSARQYLANHPDADQAVTAAQAEPRAQASSDLRRYFTAHPQQYDDLHGILAPIGNVQRQCNVSALPPALASAYDEFMAG